MEKESYFNGGFWHLVGLCIGGFIVCAITLGIAFPWVCCWFIRWQTNYTVIQGKRLQFNGTGLSLFGHFILKGWLLGLILGPLTLGLYWIYYFCVSLKKWITKNTSFEGESIQNTSNANSPLEKDSAKYSSEGESIQNTSNANSPREKDSAKYSSFDEIPQDILDVLLKDEVIVEEAKVLKMLHGKKEYNSFLWEKARIRGL